jgi:exosortase/archaeosortase family protein
VWHWIAARLGDGSDDPLGIIALMALLISVWRERHHFNATLRPLWLGAGLCLAGLAVIGATAIPPLLRAVIAVTAVLAVLMALRAPRQPILAWTGLGILSLPLISSLQFFIGYPLRVITAEVSAHILRTGGLEVIRDGSALLVNGQLVMVDAPCSGIQMGWFAYFTACIAASWLRLPDGLFSRRMAGVGLIVLAGNIVRNTLLVVKESNVLPLPAWTHEATGLLVFGGVCVLVLWLTSRGAVASVRSGASPAVPNNPEPRPIRYFTPLAIAGFAILSLLPMLSAPAVPSENRISPFVEWPHMFEGRTLRPLALSAVEERFAQQFPGVIARFANGERIVTLRLVNKPTRKLHPAADCYRGLGYRIDDINLHRRPGATAMQRCFTASKGQTSLRVCEYITDQAGRSFSDTSAWYWAGVMGKSQGPWQAVTTTETLENNR